MNNNTSRMLRVAAAKNRVKGARLRLLVAEGDERKAAKRKLQAERENLRRLKNFPVELPVVKATKLTAAVRPRPRRAERRVEYR